MLHEGEWGARDGQSRVSGESLRQPSSVGSQLPSRARHGEVKKGLFREETHCTVWPSWKAREA